MMTPRGHSAEV